MEQRSQEPQEDPGAAARPQATPEKAGLRTLAALWPYLKPHGAVLLAAALSLVVAAGSVLAIGQAIRRVVDHGFGGDGAVIDQYFLALLGVVFVLAAATFARYYAVTWLGERVVADLRRSVYDHLVGLSAEFYESTKVGEVLSRLSADTTLVQTVVGATASVAMRNLLLLLGGSVLLLISSPKLTGLVFLVVPVVIVPIVLFGRRVRRLSRASQDRLADIAGYAGETLTAVQVVQAFTREAASRLRFRALVEGAFGTAVERTRARAWLTALVMLLVFGAVDLIVWVGAKDVAGGAMSGGELAAFVFYAIVVAGAMGALSEVYGELQRAAGAVERLLELLRVRPVVQAPSEPLSLPLPPRGEVRFDNVTFRYPSRPETTALNGFSLHVRPGETVALVGPSGAGKSTVFHLLLRFYDPQSGRVLLDGVEAAAADPAALRSRMALVPQEAMLFADSALENIRFGRPDATTEEVRRAADAAHALAFLEALPEGLETPLGERGVRLSGGQRQRIAIARAILRDAPILLLDEATSALDAESERLVQAALERLMAGRTTLVIAHRLATILRADRIVVMEHGRIVETGTHDELVRRGGLYAGLAALQFETGSAPPPAEIAGARG